MRSPTCTDASGASGKVAALARVSETARDRDWFQSLLTACGHARFHRSAQPGCFYGPRLPCRSYEVTSSRGASARPLFRFFDVLELCLRSGAGLRVACGGGRPVYVPYGLLWSYFQFGTVDGDPLDQPERMRMFGADAYGESSTRRGKLLFPIHRQILPLFALRGLYPFLRVYAAEKPAIAILVDGDEPPFRSLLFRVDPSTAPDHDWLATVLLPSYLPPHRAFRLVGEGHPLSRHFDRMTTGRRRRDGPITIAA
jgi:hypothetical protein